MRTSSEILAMGLPKVTFVTPVIFRKWNDGEIIAIFPTIVADQSPHHCMSYAHVGQHGACSPDTVIEQTVLAKPEEYSDLLTELKNIGYDHLKVAKRIRREWTECRNSRVRAGAA